MLACFKTHCRLFLGRMIKAQKILSVKPHIRAGYYVVWSARSLLEVSKVSNYINVLKVQYCHYFWHFRLENFKPLT
jgi:hypothetical protein